MLTHAVGCVRCFVTVAFLEMLANHDSHKSTWPEPPNNTTGHSCDPHRLPPWLRVPPLAVLHWHHTGVRGAAPASSALLLSRQQGRITCCSIRMLGSFHSTSTNSGCLTLAVWCSLP